MVPLEMFIIFFQDQWEEPWICWAAVEAIEIIDTASETPIWVQHWTDGAEIRDYYAWNNFRELRELE